MDFYGDENLVFGCFQSHCSCKVCSYIKVFTVMLASLIVRKYNKDVIFCQAKGIKKS